MQTSVLKVPLDEESLVCHSITNRSYVDFENYELVYFLKTKSRSPVRQDFCILWSRKTESL